ncbi:MAG: beta-ketoacyl-[acyl-carrier-protein] synthase family protein [Planctomycetales bacterium]|nr:beta-ketoacyl-[acyl-carrier-protein] synthase family protein [Planctomycetales bacterium]
MSESRERVVITGMGCVTPLGIGLRDTWDALARGCSGVAPITLFDASTFPVRMAAEVKHWDIEQFGESRAQWERQPRQTQFAVVAADQAARQAGMSLGEGDPIRQGVYLGCGELFPDLREMATAIARATVAGELDFAALNAQLLQHPGELDELSLDPGLTAALIAGRLGLQGPNANFTAACVSSTQAIGEASEVIRRGEADLMLAGGTHSMIHPLGVSTFHLLSTLSTRNDIPTGAARPFDRERDGFVIGEGGAVVVLESLEHARRRGAHVLAELVGFGSTHDAYRITDLESSGRAASRAIRLALEQAAIAPEEIGYINAHGSGTLINDRVETLIVKNTMGSAASRIPISSTKSMTGHLTTACGALELVIAVLALQEQLAPPTINLHTPDPDCDLDYVPLVARPIQARYAMSNNFGFGGQNVSLIVSNGVR